MKNGRADNWQTYRLLPATRRARIVDAEYHNDIVGGFFSGDSPTSVLHGPEI